ncbi:hypothetical protein CDD81_6280 [Ophiocordyceps australis]|uniref:Protein prenyltransferase alpha subunit repeat-containing protein 1 n=1 Tax=Ophiocordyceps australis TaxID=1399860 RepID=A0A2C5X9J5_9HYPO|nr:hypothetical protein CDD81_6280 [Ophiocordyceps australis]
MSRALEKGIQEALEHADLETPFEHISTALSQKCDALLDIELLGPSHASINATLLQDGNAIAIPKRRLVEAFIHARKGFILCQQSKEPQNTRTQHVLFATAVMLLMDPENLSAANARKRVLSETLETCPNDVAPLLNEKYLIDSLLTSRLHRHTKSPTLWSHRRWLMQRISAMGVANSVVEELASVVFVSAERHPRNYYAWCHARLLVESTVANSGKPGVELDTNSMIQDTKKWCFNHHDDISGWMFLAFLLQKWPSCAASVLRETLQLVQSFRWRNESVWHFLRNVVSMQPQGAGLLVNQVRTVCNTLLKDAADRDQKVLNDALKWLERFTEFV